MFIQPHYYVTYITSFSDYIGAKGMLFSERQDRKFLLEIAKSYSYTSNVLVFFGLTENSQPEKIFFQGKEMHRSENDDEVTYITIDELRIKTLKESSEGFYLATQEFKL
jgi:hypothetical protein